MSAFLLQPGNNKPANKLEFVSQKEAVALLGVDQRTIRRYMLDPQIREILGAVYHRGRWQIPRSSFEAPWRIAVVLEQLASIGKGRDNSFGSIIRRESGMANPRLERDAKRLRLALEIERRSRKRRLTQRANREIEKVSTRARSVASKYRCSVFNAPKFYGRWLTAQNDREKKRNAPAIKWLKKHGLLNKAKTLVNSAGDYSESQDNSGKARKMFFGKGSGYFDAVIGWKDADGKSHNFLLPNSFTEGKNLRFTCLECRSIHLSPVKTKAQIAREVRTFKKCWPSRRSIEAATEEHDRIWQLLDHERAAAECRRQKKQSTPENLKRYLYRDEIAQRQGRPGISRSTYFRRYPKDERTRVRRLKSWGDEQRLPGRKSGGASAADLYPDDLKNMTVRTAKGWEVSNPYGSAPFS